MLLLVIAVVIVIIAVLSFYFVNQGESGKNISVLWPQSGVVLTDQHHFMAYVPDRALGTYNLYWKLNNGTWVEMEDSFDEIPHKALDVDTENWESVVGEYKVEFIAKDARNGGVLGRTSVVAKSADTQEGSFFGRMFAAAGAVGKSKQSSLEGFLSSDMSVDWVTEGTKDMYDQEFEITVSGFSSDKYYMFWQVGSSAYNRVFSETGAGVVATINFDSWDWREDGPYELSFVLQDQDGKEVGRKKFNIYRFAVNGEEYVATTESAVVSGVVEEEEELEVPTELPETPQERPEDEINEDIVAVNATTVNLQGKELYIPRNKAADVMLSTSSVALDTLLGFIADESQGIWLTGNTLSDTGRVLTAMSNANADELPVFVLYSIPSRDCGSHSAGGSRGAQEYLAWVEGVAQAASSGEAIFIVEPDALTHTSCLSATEIVERLELVQNAVKILKNNVDSRVYIDAGHPYWLSVSSAVDRLRAAGIEFADGFALNTSNYHTTADNILYGNNIISRLALDEKRFVIDSGRNGVGPTQDNQWCNPSDRALGNSPQLLPGLNYVDAYLWVKPPGESDGLCNGGPVAGVWWLQQAVDLVIEMLEKETQSL